MERQRTTEQWLNPTQLLLFFREPSREASLKRLIPLMCAVMRRAGWGWGWGIAAASIPQLWSCGWETDGGPAWLGLGGWPLATGNWAKVRQPVRLKVVMPTTLISYRLLRGFSACQHKEKEVQGGRNRRCMSVEAQKGGGGGGGG